MLDSAAADFAALWPCVKADAEAKAHEAKQKLTQRGQQEARALKSIILAHRERIEDLYDVVLERLEPVGMVYLWPTTRL